MIRYVYILDEFDLWRWARKDLRRFLKGKETTGYLVKSAEYNEVQGVWKDLPSKLQQIEEGKPDLSSMAWNVAVFKAEHWNQEKAEVLLQESVNNSPWTL